LGREQVRAVNGEEGSVLLDEFATGENEELLDVAVHAADVIPVALLVVSDRTDGTEREGERKVCDGRAGPSRSPARNAPLELRAAWPEFPRAC
jgi:hypothetical protein